jgi:hypothetical protein
MQEQSTNPYFGDFVDSFTYKLYLVIIIGHVFTL